jgi:hypothetical protein
MLTRIAIAFAMFFASPASPAGISFLDGNKLHSYCNYDNTNIMSGVCAGYIIGVADSLSKGPVAGFNACIPQGPVVEQLRDLVAAWIKNNPTNRHYSGEAVVAWALSEAFPCNL